MTNMNNKETSTIMKLAETAILAALCYVSFTFLQIKIPVPGGDATSLHIGNAFCVLAALLLGGVYGGIIRYCCICILSCLFHAGLTIQLLKELHGIFIQGVLIVRRNIIAKDVCLITSLCLLVICQINESTDKSYVFKWSLIASVAGLAFNVVADPIVGFFYKQYILGQPQEMAAVLAKLSAVTTFVNAVVSVILVVFIYNALRPALIKMNLIQIHPVQKDKTVSAN